MTPVKELPLDDTEKVRTIRTSNDLAEAIATGTLDYKNTMLAKHIDAFYAPKIRAAAENTPKSSIAQKIRQRIGGWHQLNNKNGDWAKIQTVLQEFGWPKELSCVGWNKTRILEMLDLVHHTNAPDLSLTVPLEPKEASAVNEAVSLPSISQGDS